MSKVIFLTQPSVGHLNTLLSIASQMKDEGHDVQFIVPVIRGIRTGIHVFDTGIEIPERIKRNNIECKLIPPHPSLIWDSFFLPFKSGQSETMYAFSMFFKAIEFYTRHILLYINKYKPDILVSDFAFPASSLVADIAKIPYVVIYHSGLPFRGNGIPPFGSGLPIGNEYNNENNTFILQENQLIDSVDKRINKARKTFGLPQTESDFLRRPYSPWLNLIASSSNIEAPRNNLTSNTFFIGPCFAKRTENAEFNFNKLHPDTYKIYISFGTIFNKKPEVFRKIMRALDTPDYQVIISAGGAYDILLKGNIPPNVLIYKSVPQIRLLKHINLFISHGGNNSINEALASGKPIIVMPIGGEQADNASRIEYLGVGKRINIANFNENQLINTVEIIRNTSSFNEQAQHIMNDLKLTHGTITASRCIAWVAQQKTPLINILDAADTINEL